MKRCVVFEESVRERFLERFSLLAVAKSRRDEEAFSALVFFTSCQTFALPGDR